MNRPDGDGEIIFTSGISMGKGPSGDHVRAAREYPRVVTDTRLRSAFTSRELRATITRAKSPPCGGKYHAPAMVATFDARSSHCRASARPAAAIINGLQPLVRIQPCRRVQRTPGTIATSVVGPLAMSFTSVLYSVAGAFGAMGNCNAALSVLATALRAENDCSLHFSQL
jgi:hypothetical protein